MAETFHRALICVTTCQRPHFLHRYLAHFAAFCRDDPRFHLLVALDGDDRETRTFCDEWQIPLVFSDTREGVGLSKNRVLERHGDYAYYFFLDDDVELIDGAVFAAHVELSRQSGIHHFSLFEEGGVRRPTGETHVGSRRIVHGLFGGGQFNFYTGEGLRRVGGWHPRFAEFRRWGHTEHSYRFFRAGLAPAPFNVAEELSESCIWHYPPAVAGNVGMPVDSDQIPLVERELIEEGLVHVPLRTLAEHHTNGVSPETDVGRLAAVLDGGDRYPLVRGAERRRCLSDYHLWRVRTSTTRLERVGAMLASLQSPGNPALRHAVRTALTR